MSTVCLKVVWHASGHLESLWASRQAQVIYPVRKWVYAPAYLLKAGYGLTAFLNEEQATAYVREMFTRSHGQLDPHVRLFRCEADGPMELQPRLEDWAFEKGIVRPELKLDNPWPIGTVMYRQIKLVEGVSL